MSNPTEAPPVCPRHPDRISYVRCQRCGRPVCPDCQRPAAVGVQCVDCVKQHDRGARRPVTMFGAPIGSTKPIVTYTLIAICVLVFIATYVLPGNDVVYAMAFSPAAGEVQPWRFLTSAFLHYNIWHIALNMYALWVVGSQLEMLLGKGRYITLYLLSGIGGSVMVLLLASPTSDSWTTAVLGASGAIFGLFGAMLPVVKRLGQDARGVLAIIGINVVFSFVVANIAWQAHIGGLVTGLVLGAAYAYIPTANRRVLTIGASVLVGVLLVALAVGKYAVAA